MSEQSVLIAELREQDLPFLFELWHTPAVMQYADEFPRLRGWSRADDLGTAWRAYRERLSPHRTTPPEEPGSRASVREGWL
jgi:hypothetical protein